MLKGFFEISRAFRQGDPLSPSLYIIMVEAFRRVVTHGYNTQQISGIKVVWNIPNITHQQYADDMILLGKSTMTEEYRLKSIIN